MMKEIPSSYTHTHKHIILACKTLHNFICDNNLQDREFDRCDADEEYLVGLSNSVTQAQGDESSDGDNVDTMSTIQRCVG